MLNLLIRKIIFFNIKILLLLLLLNILMFLFSFFSKNKNNNQKKNNKLIILIIICLLNFFFLLYEIQNSLNNIRNILKKQRIIKVEHTMSREIVSSFGNNSIPVFVINKEEIKIFY